MIKNTNKSQRNIPDCPDEQRHKKKSDKKGLARSKHKHQYRTVLLLHDYSITKPHDPHPWKVHYYSASKVCSICGRVSYVDNNYYSRNVCGAFITESYLIEDAYKLDRYVVRELCGKYCEPLDSNNFTDNGFCSLEQNGKKDK